MLCTTALVVRVEMLDLRTHTLTGQKAKLPETRWIRRQRDTYVYLYSTTYNNGHELSAFCISVCTVVIIQYIWYLKAKLPFDVWTSVALYSMDDMHAAFTLRIVIHPQESVGSKRTQQRRIQAHKVTTTNLSIYCARRNNTT